MGGSGSSVREEGREPSDTRERIQEVPEPRGQSSVRCAHPSRVPVSVSVTHSNGCGKPIQQLTELYAQHVWRSYHHVGRVWLEIHLIRRLSEPALRPVALNSISNALTCNDTDVRCHFLASGLENCDPTGPPSWRAAVDISESRPRRERDEGAHLRLRGCGGPWCGDA